MTEGTKLRRITRTWTGHVALTDEQVIEGRRLERLAEDADRTAAELHADVENYYDQFMVVRLPAREQP